MNHLIYEPEYTAPGIGDRVRVFAYIQPNRKIVVRWEAHDNGWHYFDDHVCEDFDHFIDVWESRWAE